MAGWLGIGNLTALVAAPWSGAIMQPGIAALTCAAPANAPLTNAWVLGVMDFRNPPAVMYGIAGPSAPLWNPPGYHHPDWTAERMGSVYGLAIDGDGDMYVAAHGLYAKNWFWAGIGYHHRYGNIGGGSNSLAAAGTIYRVDRNTGVASVFAVLPQQAMTLSPGWVSGPGLGNVAYDAVNQQFFATNLEDGRIYRLSSTGTLLQTFDPLASDSGAPGLPPASERMWGIGVSKGAVFYGVWNTGNLADPGKIRRTLLSGAALDISSDLEVLTVPGLSGVESGGAPVTDLAFSADGTRMVIGQRTMRQLGTPPVPEGYNHASRVYVAALTGTNWTVTHTLPTGFNSFSGEAYGGVAYGYEGGLPEQVIWMTSADTATWAGPHGVQGTRPLDFPPASSPYLVTNSFRVPYDPTWTTAGPDVKGSGGDIEIMQDGDCSRLEVLETPCPEKPDQPFTVTVSVQNLSGITATYGWWNPCPTNDLPPGAVTAQPTPASLFALPGGGLPHLGSAPLQLELPPGLGGQTVCILLTLLDDSGRVCCTQKVCINLPACDCAAVLEPKIECKPQADGTIAYTITFTLQNLTHLSALPFPFYQVTFLPPSGFSPASVTPSPSPIPPGGSGTVSVTYTGLPGQLCFTLGVHDIDIEPCCFIPVCLDLPDCRTDHPDTCAVETVVACVAGPPGTPPGLGTATLNYTLCNNSSTARTYAWSIQGLTPAPPCTQILAPGDFSPGSGSVTLPAGGCLTIPITVTCRDWKPGDCAGFEVCARPEGTDERFCCRGIIRRPLAGVPTVRPIIDPTVGLPVIASGGTASLLLELTNPTDQIRSVTVLVLDQDGLLEITARSGSTRAIQGTRSETPGAGVRSAGEPNLDTFDLAPLETRTLPLIVYRWLDSIRDPYAAPLHIYLREGGSTLESLLATAPDLVVPVIRSPRTTEITGAPSISGIRVEASAPPRAVVQVLTQPGARYRLERAVQLSGPWAAAAGFPESHDANGEFVAEGMETTCLVPCEPGETSIFFRVAAIP
jgi:hypothetical protein